MIGKKGTSKAVLRERLLKKGEISVGRKLGRNTSR